MRVTVIGAKGFVGSAFVRLLSGRDIDLVEVEQDDYSRSACAQSDIVIEAACNSRKYLAEERPFEEFDSSVAHRLRTLRDFPAKLHVHISSVDVYSDLSSPEKTRESSPIDITRVSNYGLHKLMAEDLVRHYAERWLIVRLAGMVGPGLRKNPVYDILRGQPLRIHPDSRYQFMPTDDVARIVWRLVESGVNKEIVNVCGDGLISPAEIAVLAGKKLNLEALDPAAVPRVVHANTAKIARIARLPETRGSVAAFAAGWKQAVP